MALRKVIAEFPALKVVEGDTLMSDSSLQSIQAGQQYACDLKGNGLFRTFTAFSMMHNFVTYTQNDIGRTLESEIAKNIKNGGKTHDFYANGSMIHSGESKQEVLQEVKVGSRVAMEGIIFIVERANNDNLTLVKE